MTSIYKSTGTQILMETSKQKFLYFVYWTAIFVVSGSMLVYGIAKPIQFQNFAATSNSNLSEGHQVMWTFYSYTKAYPIIIGVFEVIGAVAILFNRTRVFGCILLTVILSNIIIQDYLYDVFALSTAVFYQILVLLILLFDYEKVKAVVRQLFKSQAKNRHFVLLFVALIFALVIKFFESKILSFFL